MLFRVKPTFNAKAMGLFSSAYLDLFILTKKRAYLDKANECINWLQINNIKINNGFGWGYPFDWQSKEIIPAFTPNGIVTTAVGEAFWKFYLYTKENDYLQYCKKIAEFLNSLPTDSFNDNICFSYTPLYINHVHNLNLFVAEFLIKVGKEIDNTEFINRGNQAVSYTISSQLPDGSFDYNGPPEKPQNFIDNYHTGFVLRMLYSIYKLTNREDVEESLAKCYKHYSENFFEKDGLPKLMPNRKYRIDIHSAAEGIHCLSELSEKFPEAIHLAEKVMKWTIKNLQNKSGYFYYGILKSKFTGFPFKSRIPYIRWGQAWMLKAYSSYLRNIVLQENA
jgi:rhamnogalacturonyl hydrolase YesR